MLFSHFQAANDGCSNSDGETFNELILIDKCSVLSFTITRKFSLSWFSSGMKVLLKNNNILEDWRLSQSLSKLALLFSPNFIIFYLAWKRSELHLQNCQKPDYKSVNYLSSPLSHTLHLANQDRLSGVREGSSLIKLPPLSLLSPDTKSTQSQNFFFFSFFKLT